MEQRCRAEAAEIERDRALAELERALHRVSMAESATEMARRALATRLEQGWGTFYNPSVVTWELLPEVRRGAATSAACMAGHDA